MNFDKLLKLEEIVESILKNESSPPKVKINPEHGRMIADAYEAMEHNPNHPDVKAAYGALIDETNNQLKDLVSKGFKFSKIQPNQENPYPTSKHMHEDVSKNKHLWYYPTESGYGDKDNFGSDPMLQDSGIEHNGHKLLNNDSFRICHDILGHAFDGATSFSPTGEHQAYIKHKKAYSSKAHPALAAQTLMQNQYVNFGPNAEHNRKNPKETIYAPQKIGIAPDWIVNGKWHGEE